MPIPAYIICSSSVTTDKETGAFSIFEVIDKLIITELPKPKKGEGVLVIERQKIVVAVTWTLDIKNGETFDDAFELQLIVKMDGGDTIMEDKRDFKFAGPDMVNHRQIYNMLGLMPIKNSGTLVVESRARKAGSASWKSQSYKVSVEKLRLEPQQDDKDSASD